jgi:glycosyltransferase involved in cell wall biosynthesis
LGPMVARSIESLAAADYPLSLLQIVVVDDGSTDDTWEHVSRAASRDPGLIKTIRFAGNRGKRAALEAGFLRARGEIVVTIDSDSVIDRATMGPSLYAGMITVSCGASANVAGAAGRYRSQSSVRNNRRKSPIVAQTMPGRVQSHAWSKIAIGDRRDTTAATTVHGGHQRET